MCLILFILVSPSYAVSNVRDQQLKSVHSGSPQIHFYLFILLGKLFGQHTDDGEWTRNQTIDPLVCRRLLLTMAPQNKNVFFSQMPIVMQHNPIFYLGMEPASGWPHGGTGFDPTAFCIPTQCSTTEPPGPFTVFNMFL